MRSFHSVLIIGAVMLDWESRFLWFFNLKGFFSDNIEGPKNQVLRCNGTKSGQNPSLIPYLCYVQYLSGPKQTVNILHAFFKAKDKCSPDPEVAVSSCESHVAALRYDKFLIINLARVPWQKHLFCAVSRGAKGLSKYDVCVCVLVCV